MNLHPLLWAACAIAPAVLMLLAAAVPAWRGVSQPLMWRSFMGLAGVAGVMSALGLVGQVWPGETPAPWAPWVQPTTLGAWLAVVVQCLGLVIGSFSARYLQGEGGQRRYLSGLAGVLASVHVLLLAGHWVVLIAAWAMVGVALQRLLCFYPDRPFAMLAALKKRMADRLADGLLLAAAGLSWFTVGSGSLTDLWAHVAQHGASPALHLAAVCLALAVVLRCALLPVHGWLIQVMEAPTPVSALLHAGVVNLGGYVLILFAPLLNASPVAQGVLVVVGLGTAVLASMVMLTRISIKVRLAWSTVAQMGFMVLECGLGLYTLAALHLIGHSLYKAHAFLASSSAVQHTRQQALSGPGLSAHRPAAWSLLLAPAVAMAAVFGVQAALGSHWPWWWSLVLALAWAPMLWMTPARRHAVRLHGVQLLLGTAMVAGLTTLAWLAHALPLGTLDAPAHTAGVLALVGMLALHAWLLLVQLMPGALAPWRRWSYAGLYLDEFYTRLALRWWPTRWTPRHQAEVVISNLHADDAQAAH